MALLAHSTCEIAIVMILGSRRPSFRRLRDFVVRFTVPPPAAATAVRAAVSVVLPWSM
jgi:hypothetical protein